MEIRCRDGCGAVAIVDGPAADPPGWQRGILTGRMRCPRCVRELEAVNGNYHATKLSCHGTEPAAGSHAAGFPPQPHGQLLAGPAATTGAIDAEFPIETDQDATHPACGGKAT